MNGIIYSEELINSVNDSDGDKVTDGLELALCTNPYKTDTDGDRLDDYVEAFVVEDNCTTFAVNALEEAGTDLPVHKYFWSYLHNALGYFSLILKGCIWWNDYGYTPGDAGEDVRDTGEYIYKGELGVADYTE
jgi:hypothetical protein